MFGGKVVHGDSLGRTYGFPTANIEIAKDQLKIQAGVYAGKARINHVDYQAAVVVIENPWKVEVFLLDYAGQDFYDSYLEFDVVEKVGEIEEFDNEEELKVKINSDILKIKKILEN